MKPFSYLVALVGAVVFSSTLYAQQAAAPAAPAAPPPPYGVALTLEQARKMMAGAEAEARKNNWSVAIAIVDSGSQLVMFQRIDATQHASIDIAIGKAVTAVNYRRPTKALEDAIAAGGAGLRLTALKGITPLEGGILVVVDGKIAGGIGVSGVLSSQDAQVARAGFEALGR